MPVDPFSNDDYAQFDDYPYYELPPPPYSDRSWYEFSIDDLIRRGAETAQIIGAGWPSANVVYAPQFPGQQTPQTVQQTPLPLPASQQPQMPGQGIQLSPTTLLLLVGGFLLFTLGKRGR